MKEKIKEIVKDIETKVSTIKTNICISCKNKIDKFTEICPHCGVRNNDNK